MATEIELELSKATKMKQGKQERQPFLVSLAKAVQDLKEADWDKLTEEAQDWSNAAAGHISKKKEVEDFDTPAEEEEEEKAAAPKKKKKTPNKPEPVEEEDEEEEEEEEEEEKAAAPKKKKKAEAEDEDEEEEEEEEEDEPAPKKKPKKKVVEEEDEDEEEAPPPAEPPKKKKSLKEPAKKKKAAAPAPAPKKGLGVKERIKDAILGDVGINVEDLVKKLGKDGGTVSKVTVSNIRAEFRHTLKFLKMRNKLKGIEI